MRAPLPSLALVLWLAGASATAASGKLVVCVEEAQSLADLDAGEKPGTEGSDAFVALFVGGQADANQGAWRKPLAPRNCATVQTVSNPLSPSLRTPRRRELPRDSADSRLVSPGVERLLLTSRHTHGRHAGGLCRARRGLPLGGRRHRNSVHHRRRWAGLAGPDGPGRRQ